MLRSLADRNFIDVRFNVQFDPISIHKQTLSYFNQRKEYSKFIKTKKFKSIILHYSLQHKSIKERNCYLRFRFENNLKEFFNIPVELDEIKGLKDILPQSIEQVY